MNSRLLAVILLLAPFKTLFGQPILASLTPADNSTSVLVNADLTINFDVPIQKGTGNILVKKTSDNSTVLTINVTSSTVTVAGSSATIFTDFDQVTALYIIVPAGAFKDLSNNNFAGLLTPTDWNFTTGNAVDYCNLQFPSAGTDQFIVYAHVYELGVTEAAGPGAGISAWIGISPAGQNTNPDTWTTWIPATFNVQVGNNDEFQATIGTGPVGTYYYASRFQVGSSGYRYGGTNNAFWNGATSISGVLTISTPTNNAPTDIALTSSSINESVAANSTVGTLSSTDPDVANTFTYTLVAGTGSTDNASFNISGSNLRITASPDFETKASYSIRLRSTDQGSLTYEEAFVITINNLNESPTDMALTASSVDENVAANTTVGTLSSTDPDAANTFTYTLVAGTGSTDNASFNISGSNLRITSSPDFETKASYSIRLRSTDQGSLTYEEVFTITINNINESPTDMALTASSINENVAANSTVGTLSSTDPDAANTFTYTLVAGTGSTDNASFNISGSNLRITASPDFETKASYSIRLRSTDQGSLTYEEAFVITINNLNESPTDMALTASSVDENVAANTTVGTLSSTDPDAANTFTYTLVAGTGSTDNASFNISGSNLRITSSPDFETKASYSIRLRSTDQGSLTYEEVFTITINNINESPTDMALTSSSVGENVAANSTVGTLSSTDPDAANTFTYTLVAGTGSTDNASFNISGSNLRITASPDFETKASYSIRLRSTDQNTLTYEEVFTITITNINESPTDMALTASSIDENVAANSTVGTLSSTDPDAANTFTYTLVAGIGSTDNASFDINGTSLRIISSPDFESKSSYSIRLRSTDQGSLTYEEVFTITINNVSETSPTDISLTASSIDENVAANSVVGTLSTADSDPGSTFTYTLVAGAGSTDNASFTISGNQLLINGSPDFETKSSYSIRVRSTDQSSLFFEKEFTISIIDLSDVVTALEPMKTLEFSAYPNPATNQLNVKAHQSGSHHLSITNSLGIEIYRGSFSGDQEQIDTSALPNGLYYLIYRNGNSSMERSLKVLILR